MAFDPTAFDNTNWRILDGDIYVSKSGFDTVQADGLTRGTPTEPFLTISAALDASVEDQRVIVGTGVYKETYRNSSLSVEIEADGYVEMNGVDFPGDHALYLDQDALLIGFHIIDYSYSVICGTRDCVIKNSYWNQFNYTRMVNTTFINCRFSGGSNGQVGVYFIHCTFVHCAFLYTPFDPAVIRNCIFDKDCGNVRANFENMLESDYNCWENNMIQGKTLADHQTTDYVVDNSTSTPTTMLFDANSIAVDPKFNEASKEDYTLMPDSPCLQAASDGRTIGAFTKGTFFDGANDGMNGDATLNNISYDTDGNATLSDPTAEGTIESAVLNLGEVKDPMGVVRLRGENNFPAELIDSNVGSGTENPNQLTYEMRYAETGTPAGNYAQFIWNEVPTVDNSGRGNGDVDFVRSEATTIKAQFVQVKITLTPNGDE